MSSQTLDNAQIVDGVNRKISEILGDEIPILTSLKNYVIESGGKRVRSLVGCYIGELYGIPVQDSLKISAIVEIIHAASLLHDDVLDDASIRRGKPSGKTVFGSKEVILGGDYMFATAIRSLNDYENPRLMDIFTRVIRDLSIGELYQLEYEGRPEITMEIYLRIIYSKTGSLFQTTFEAMGIQGKRPAGEVLLLAETGKDLGLLFQIRDDYLDYFNGELLQKRPYQDFENGLFTYPVLIARDQLSGSTKEEFLAYFNLSIDERKNPDTIRAFLELMNRNKIREACASHLGQLAEKLLGQIQKLPEHPFREKIENQVLKLMKLD